MEDVMGVTAVFAVVKRTRSFYPGVSNRVRVCCLTAGEQEQLTGCQSQRREEECKHCELACAGLPGASAG